MKTNTTLPPYLTSAPVVGFYRRVKTIIGLALPGVMILTPQLRYDRGSGVTDQAILLDIAERRAYIFGLELLPDELFFILAALVCGAMTLFAVTARFGRVWCGFTCPQTVWTDIFVAIERFFLESLNRHPLVAKGITYIAWALISALTSYGWISYFHDARVIPREFLSGETSPTLAAMAAIFAMATLILAGFARGKVCTHMCPWPRFQSAMFDGRTFNIFYDESRGEPRGKGGKGKRRDEQAGDCVDCGRCVAVCPMEIDIRNGLQLSCIGCGLCADACDTVMQKVNAPKGLVRYGLPHEGEPYSRIRMAGFAVGTLSASLALCVFFIYRVPFSFSVTHMPDPLYVAMTDGSFRNSYQLHMVNRTGYEKHILLAAEGKGDIKISLRGRPSEAFGSVNLTLPARGGLTHPIYLHGKQNKEGAYGDAGAPASSSVIISATEGDKALKRSVVWWGP